MLTVGRMTSLAVGAQKTHPWWAVATGVQALAEVANQDTALGRAALVGLQIIATKFNEQINAES